MTTKVAAACIMNDYSQILLCRKASLPYYIFPGGKVNEGESIEEALKREILEELGCGITSLAFMDVINNKAPNSKPIEVHMFAVTLDGSPVAGAELVELFWYSPLNNPTLDYPFTATTKQFVDQVYGE